MRATKVAVRGQRVRRSAEQWRELVARFEQSGQSREQFCAERGLEYVVLKRTPKEGLKRRASTDLRGF